MKKISLVLILGLLLSLTACGGETAGNETTDKTDIQTESSKNEAESTQADTDEDNREAVTSIAENFKYTEENGEITITGYEGEATVLDIPESINGMPVVAIGENAFAGNEMIEEVIFPDSVIVIEHAAFERCYGLTKATFGANLEVIDGGAFWMTALESVVFPETVHTIGAYAFDSTNIKEVTIPPMVTVLGTAAFGGSEIESLTVPGTVKEIGEQAFRNCNSLKWVVIEEGVEVIGESAFGECVVLESATLPSTLTEETDVGAFWGSGLDAKLTIYVPADCVLKDEILEYYNIGYDGYDWIGAEVIE